MDLYPYVTADNDYQRVETISGLDEARLHFDGRSLVNSWAPMSVRLVREGLPADFVGFLRRIPVLTRSCWEILSPYIANEVEVLPLDCPDIPLVALNVINVVDCLDVSRSQVQRLESGHIWRVFKYAFKNNHIDAFHLVVLAELPRSNLLVTENFRRLVEDNHLRGLVFRPILQVS